jgi:hypothetical protein
VQHVAADYRGVRRQQGRVPGRSSTAAVPYVRGRTWRPHARRVVSSEHWTPRCAPAEGLVRPVRIDPAGANGPTRGQAQRGRWRRATHGWYVPSGVDGTRVEQRILEQSVRVCGYGAVTAWASLRWRGAAYFDGTGAGPDDLLPVPLLRASGGHALTTAEAAIGRSQLARHDRELVRGVWCTTPRRAVFDEVQRLGVLRPSVVAVCMAVAAGLTDLEELTVFERTTGPWTGMPLLREALALSGPGFRSGPEVRTALCWVLDAGLDPPLVNRPVFDLAGRLLGLPDLLDPVAGVVVEYDGAAHKDRERHRRDVAREDRFRRCGLEYLTVVAGDLDDPATVVSRIHAARARARFEPPDRRRWTLTAPPGWRLPGRGWPSQPG